jgi:hypothetical protein
MKKAALVTCNEQEYLIEGERALLECFKGYNINAIEVPWNKSNIDWNDFDVVVLRQCWNYHKNLSEFTEWINKLKKDRVNLWNQQDTILWNLNKKYLFDLEQRGVRIIPSSLVTSMDLVAIKKIADKNGWNKVVVKPTVGAASFKTYLIDVVRGKTSPEVNYKHELSTAVEYIIQPFLPEVVAHGEYSFIFFDKQFSHSVIKKPRYGDFRTQTEFGGQERIIIPDSNLISQARDTVFSIKDDLSYARVDCIDLNGELYLMELELIEPYLFFEYSEQATNKFVQSLINLNNW